MSPPRVTLFDTVPDGHHPVMLRAIAAGLADVADLTACVSTELAERAGTLPARVEVVDAPDRARAALGAFERAIERTRPDHAFHLYAIRPVLAAWLLRRRAPVPVTALVISPAALHYPRDFATPLSAAERANALVKEALVRRWRRRRDAHAIVTMDAIAADRWNRSAGAPAFALPEPPVPDLIEPVPAARRRGCVIYGAMSARKGVGLLADALAEDAGGIRVTLAGKVEEGYRERFAADVARLRAAGARVEVADRWLDDRDVQLAVASARCAVIAYVGHKGTSRVLVEAAARGTPVVAHDRGMIGGLVRDHGLGLAVDCTDPVALRAAVLELTRDPGAVERYAPALNAFARRSSPEAFAAAVRAPFGLA